MIQGPDRRTSAEAADPRFERVLDVLAEDATRALEEARRLARIERERLRIGAERMLARTLGYLCAGAAAAAIAVGASLRFLDGLSGGLAAATGREWAGDLIAGVVLLLACALCARAAWSLRDRRRLARLRAELEPQGDPS